MADLFRKEALDKQGQNLFGDIILASPISHKATVALLAVIMAGIIIFSTIGEYSRKERVVGFLSSNKGLIEVRPLQTGVIEEVLVKVGQDVEKGDYLFSIKPDIMSVSDPLEGARSEDRYALSAPVSGRVVSLIARQGQTVDPRSAIATIIPTGAELVAELLVPSRSAGFIASEQPVRVLYDAFPYQKHGFYKGSVSSVSQTVIAPSELPYAFNFQQPIFLVTVKLERQNVEINDVQYDLRAGMTLTADIILEDRKVWQWPLEPVLGAAKK